MPGDSLLLLAGTTVTSPVRFAALVTASTLGSLLGESIGYLLGRRYGRRVRHSRLLVVVHVCFLTVLPGLVLVGVVGVGERRGVVLVVMFRASTIRRWQHDAGILRRPPGRQSQAPALDLLRWLYQAEGLSTTQIGVRYGVSQQAAHRWLRAAGVPPRPQGHPARTPSGLATLP